MAASLAVVVDHLLHALVHILRRRPFVDKPQNSQQVSALAPLQRRLSGQNSVQTPQKMEAMRQPVPVPEYRPSLANARAAVTPEASHSWSSRQ